MVQSKYLNNKEWLMTKDSLLKRGYVTVLVAVSTGSVLTWLVLATSQYYVCDTNEGGAMTTAVAIDAVRVAMALMGVVVVQTPADRHKRVLSTVCCMLSCGILLAGFISWSSACEGCIMRSSEPNQFNAALAQMFDLPTSSGNPCEGGVAAVENYWFNPESYCRQATKVNCYNMFVTQNVEKIKSIQPCVRYGCTDFLPEGQWAFLIEIIGDLCRVLIFYTYTVAVDRGRKAASLEAVAPVTSGTESSLTASALPRPLTIEMSNTVRQRKPGQNQEQINF